MDEGIIIEVLDEAEGIPLVFTMSDLRRSHTLLFVRTAITVVDENGPRLTPTEFQFSMN